MKSIGLLFILLLFAACTPTPGGIFDMNIPKGHELAPIMGPTFDATEDKIFGVVESALKKEKPDIEITEDEEDIGQDILTNNRQYEYTTWQNSMLGELRMAPTSTFKKKNVKCRGYRVDYWFKGSIKARLHTKGVACINDEGKWIVSK